LNIDKSLISHLKPKSPVSEAYRVLRTNLLFASVDKPLKVITVTSSGPSEGKTTIISNLSITFAQSGNRVLLIDADMRKPGVDKVFGLQNKAGLTNVLALKQDYKKLIHADVVSSMDVLTSGPIPPNPSELLSSNRMKDFVKRIREDYDIVFIDAPPAGPVTDAAILSTIVDGTILVAASGQVHIDEIKRAKSMLDNVNANILGVVLNKMDGTQGGYYYTYYDEDPHTGTKIKKKKKAKSVVDLG